MRRVALAAGVNVKLLAERFEMSIQVVERHFGRYLTGDEGLRGYQRRVFTMVGCVHQIAACCARTDRHQAKGSA